MQQQIDLGGQWEVQQAGKAEKIPATVPGCIHTDLLAAGKIEDPFYRDHEIDLMWIGDQAWTYSRTFELPAGFLSQERILLRCEGLDTFAHIGVNGHEVARTDNNFRTYEFDVKKWLRPGKNAIVVRFDSVFPYIRRQQKLHKLATTKRVAHEPEGRSHVRKSPCNFGWDWGCILVTCGVWRPLRLVGFDSGRLTDVHIKQDHSRKGAVRLEVEARAEILGRKACRARVSVKFGGKTEAEAVVPVRAGVARAELVVKNPQLWWPRGMGSQPLYTVSVELLDEGGAKLDETSRRIGLRTLRLDRHKDKWGESFQFEANGVPFFAKGGNWIPADALVTRITRAHYENLLRSCAEANMNMLRVWGGGIYEPDVFYDLCDELGLCVWQDFMFACASYPAFDAKFLKNVKAEAEDNVRRIRHHASLALWCGNNEIEQNGFVNDDAADRMRWRDYEKLFDTLLREVVEAVDPERDYWPSSPHTPGLKGDARRTGASPDSGDAHLWAVWHGKQPFEWYRTCTHRFNSEFGFQSFPEPKTVCGYTAPEDRNVTTHVMEHHQRSGIGNSTIMTYMLDWFRLPTAFDSTLWLSQILQGMAMKYACEHWRRCMPRGMGTLYWQINDNWPVASWASIDYHGRWKALQYMARNFFAPVLVSGVEDLQKGTVAIHATSDLKEAVKAKQAWTLTDLSGQALASGKKALTVKALGSQEVETLKLAKLIEKHGMRNLLLWLELAPEGQAVSRNLVHFARPKHLELEKPRFDLKIVKRDGAFEVSVSTDKPALWAWLELKDADANFSDNFLHLRPGVTEKIMVWPLKKELTREQLVQQLAIKSLVDTY